MLISKEIITEKNAKRLRDLALCYQRAKPLAAIPFSAREQTVIGPLIGGSGMPHSIYHSYQEKPSGEPVYQAVLSHQPEVLSQYFRIFQEPTKNRSKHFGRLFGIPECCIKPVPSTKGLEDKLVPYMACSTQCLEEGREKYGEVLKLSEPELHSYLMETNL